MTSIIASIITAIVTVLTVIINSKLTNSELQHKLETQQAVINTKIDSLTNEVNKHNHFAERVPVVEEQIKVINHRLEDLERENKNH